MYNIVDDNENVIKEKEIKFMKKKLSVFVVVLVLCFMTFGYMRVNASSKIVLNSGDEETGVRLCSLDDIEYQYYIEIGDETNVGYVVNCVRNIEKVLGTCKIYVIDEVNSTNYLLCNSDDNNMGTVVITITENEQIVTNVTGEISNVFHLGSSVSINE